MPKHLEQFKKVEKSLANNCREQGNIGFKIANLLFKLFQLKVVDSRPARPAGRVKKSCFKTLENFCVCYEGSILYTIMQDHKIHPVLLANKFSISKNTQNANFTKIWLKQAF